ncbi:MAG: DUF4157 domain-containing protein [Acidimicrobiia bacterium]
MSRFRVAVIVDVDGRFSHVDAVDVERARIVVVPWLTPGVLAMTLGRYVLVRRGHETNRDLIAHELVHVEQWRRQGRIGFLRAYLGDYVRGRRAGLGHWDAYRAIRAEAEARTRVAD